MGSPSPYCLLRGCWATARALSVACRRTAQAPVPQLPAQRCPASPAACQSLSNGAVLSGSPPALQRSNGAGSPAPVLELQPAEAPLRLFDSIPEAVADVAAGKMVVVLDNEDRENEGDLIMAGQHVRSLPVQRFQGSPGASGLWARPASVQGSCSVQLG